MALIKVEKDIAAAYRFTESYVNKLEQLIEKQEGGSEERAAIIGVSVGMVALAMFLKELIPEIDLGPQDVVSTDKDEAST